MQHGMKQCLLAALVGSLSATAGAVCQYPLDATAAQYAALAQRQLDNGAGTADQPFPYINLQSAEFTATYLQPPQAYIAYSDVGLATVLGQTGTQIGDITLPASGIVALEISIDHFPPTSGESPAGAFTGSDLGLNVILAAGGMNNDQLEALYLATSFWSQSFGDNRYYATLGATSTEGNSASSGGIPLPQPLPAGFRVGFYLNMDTRQVGHTLNGVDLGYARSADGTPVTLPASAQGALIAAMGTNLVRTPNSPHIGQPVGFTLITDSSLFTQPFPAGATDICSANGGNGVLQLRNGKPYPGKGNPPGLLRFQSQLRQLNGQR